MYSVMIADDEPIVRKALVDLTDWERLDCQVVFVAKNGREVLDHIGEYHPDILITDIRMPEVSGIDIANYVYDNGLPVKIILLTAYADFSYAQAAVRYNVVEYVTKTGAMDGIESALQKTRTLIEKERNFISPENQTVLVENFLKGIFDGSICHEEDIRKGMGLIKLPLKHYLALVFRFTLAEDTGAERRNKIHHSLKNFFQMAFQGKALRGIPVSGELFCVILEEDGESLERIREKCEEIVDMMDNFMKLSVFIGISSFHQGIGEMKEAYEQALDALQSNFLQEKCKINFYEGSMRSVERYSRKTDECLEALVHEIQMGNQEEAKAKTDLFLALLKEQKLSGGMIRQLGLLLEHRCSKVLAEYEVSIQEVMDTDRKMTEQIYQCFHMTEFMDIISDMTKRTTEYVSRYNRKKNSLLVECEKLIEERYQTNSSVSEIADQLGVSAGYLSRIFKEHTGNTIIGTINKKKIEKAKTYLSATDMKIYEIADALGFDNVTYFSHFFKKYTGVSPKEFKGK